MSTHDWYLGCIFLALSFNAIAIVSAGLSISSAIRSIKFKAVPHE